MSVEKSALRKNNHKRGLDRDIEEKLYCAVRAEHAKVKQQQQREEKKKHMAAEQLPTSPGDLEVKKEEVTGHLRYAYNGFDVLVTPRKRRQKSEAKGEMGGPSGDRESSRRYAHCGSCVSRSRAV